VQAIEGTATATMLYLHGGGFVGCSPLTHRPLSASFAKHGFRVFVPDYRLAPEHPFPAAIDDAIDVWRALRAEQEATGGAQRMVVGGDSAGGTLALALMLRLRLRDAGEPLPVAAALFSPATDLAGCSASLVANAQRDAMFRGDSLHHLSEAYLAGADPMQPLASPVRADLRGFATAAGPRRRIGSAARRQRATGRASACAWSPTPSPQAPGSRRTSWWRRRRCS
jgi:monoterpene epsilon-lactone hydrolase